MSVSAVSAQLDRTFNLNFGLDSLENTQTETTTPIPILRYVDTQNPDGSYTFGYESGDGTYKIETRYATGEVKGKYGYYDDAGVFRDVEYGATPDGGFNPVGNGLEVPNTPVAPRPRTEEVRAAQQVNGRKVSVVRRKRPQGASNRRTNDPRVNLPSRRRQNPTSEVNNRRLPIRPTAAPRTQTISSFPSPGTCSSFNHFNSKRTRTTISIFPTSTTSTTSTTRTTSATCTT